MLAVPLSLSQAFEAQLVQRNVPEQQRRDFQKWLRFYLDFCDKYDSKPELTASFAKFDEKLQSKGQSESQRQQARRAIAIYYRMVGAIKSPTTPSSDSLPDQSLASMRLHWFLPLKSIGAGICTSLICNKPLNLRCAEAELPNVHRRIRFAIALPVICYKPTSIFAPFRNYWGTAI